MRKGILIIIALVQIAYGQPFFKQSGLDANSVENGIEYISGKAGLGGALNRATTIATSGNVLQFTGLPSNPTASALLVQDGTGVIGWMDKSTLNQPYNGTIVYVNSIDPNTATVFDTLTPPNVNRPSFIGLQRTLYLGTDNSTWVYNGSIYVTTASIDKTPFMLANTTSDAGSNKNNAIYRYGRLGLGHNNPQTLLDIRTNVSDTEATIQLFNTATTPSSQSRLLMRSYNHGASITTGQSNTAKGEADGLTIGVASATEDISFKVGNAVSGTATSYPMIIQHNGNVGIGVNTAANALHIKSANDPLRLVGVASGSSQDSILTIDNNTGVVYKRSVDAINSSYWKVGGNNVIGLDTSIGTNNARGFMIKVNGVQKALFQNGNTISLGTPANGTNTIESKSFFSSQYTTETTTDGDVVARFLSTIGSRSLFSGSLGNATSLHSGLASKGVVYASGQDLHLAVNNGTNASITLGAFVGSGYVPRFIMRRNGNLTSIISNPTAFTTSDTAVFISDATTSTAAAVTKTGLMLNITGNWSGAGAVKRGLDVNVSGTGTNYAATFSGGNVGVGTKTPNSTLQVNGSQSVAVLISATALTLDASHNTIIHTGAAVNYTLPAASTCIGRVYTILSHGTGNITFSLPIRTSAVSTYTVLPINTSEKIISDGTQWRTVH